MIKGKTAKLVWNDMKTYTDYNVTLRKFRKSGTDHLIKCFVEAIGSGKRVIGHVNSKLILQQIEKAVLIAHPQTKVVTYHGDNFAVEGEEENKIYHVDRKRNDLENVNKAWKEAGV